MALWRGQMRAPSVVKMSTYYIPKMAKFAADPLSRYIDGVVELLIPRRAYQGDVYARG